jgi:hypothetical protein
MSSREGRSRFVALAISALLIVSCMLPGRILSYLRNPSSMPYMEKDFETFLQIINSGDWHALEELAIERYTERDYAKPGTLAFTVTIPDEKPVYFSYGWCTTTEEILQQNFEHITVRLYFNEEELGDDVVHATSFGTLDGLVCGAFGVLMSEWSPGEYQLRAVVRFDEKINDGIADYEAGDYIFEYNVTVEN